MTVREAALSYWVERMVGCDLLVRRALQAEAGEAPRGEVGRRLAVQRQRWLRLEARNPELPIHHLRRRTGLDEPAEALLWLAVAAALDPAFRQGLARLCGEARPRLTLDLALRLLLEVRRERLDVALATGASGALRRFGLLLTADGAPWSLARPDEPLLPAPFLLPFLRGAAAVDDRLADLAALGTPAIGLDRLALHADDRAALEHLGRLGRARLPDEPTRSTYAAPRALSLLLTGPRGSGKSSAVRSLAGEAGVRLLEVDGRRLAALPSDVAGRELRVAFQQATVVEAWLLLDGLDHGLDGHEGPEHAGAADLAAPLAGCLAEYPVVTWLVAESSDAVVPWLRERFLVHHELRPLDRQRSELAWQFNLSSTLELGVGVDVRAIVDAHPLSGRGIQNALLLAERAAGGGAASQETLLEATALHRPRSLGSIARRTWVRRSRADLILEDAVAREVDEIIATERVRETVQRSWHLGERLQKGLGLVCLFDGEPGTGKTLAVEVLASELDLPLFTVNVSNVVSKWIGETEKNLQRVFDEARKTRCVVLFDEADALFARRTEVHRSVDRYANMEVGLLLQLVEEYSGLVVLTTNLKDALDSAFQRRFTFKVHFPFPSAEVRARIWRHVLPEGRVHPDVDLAALAEEYELSGGSIRTLVLRAAYRAARRNDVITAEDLRAAAWAELKASGKLVREESP